MPISRRASKLVPSATLAVSQRAAELRRAGKDVISLGAGEPDFPTPAAALEAARAAIDAGHTHYTAAAGIVELREAIARKLSEENGLSYQADQVIVGTGAKQCLYNSLLALTDPGDEVLIPAPYWVTYPVAAELVGATARFVRTDVEHGFRLQPQDLEAALTPDTRLFLFNSPSNPTGAVYDAEEIRALAEVLRRHPDVWIVTDEIYEKLVFDEARHHSLPALCPDLAERCVVLNGVSKAYAMTGWRIGYAAGPKEVIAAMVRAQGHTTSNATSVSQYAALGALQGPREALEAMRQTFARRRQRVVDSLLAVDGIRLLPPQGAFYVFPQVSAWFDANREGSVALCQKILEEVEVAVVPGAAFGNDDCLRISYATADQSLDEALRRLTVFFRDHPARGVA